MARRRARRHASLLLRSTAASVSLARTAAALEVSPSAVEHWADPDHEAALTLGDTMVLPRPVALSVLQGALAHVQAQEDGSAVAADVGVLAVLAAAGDAMAVGARGIADGHLDAAEEADLERALAALDRQTAKLRAAFLRRRMG